MLGDERLGCACVQPAPAKKGRHAEWLCATCAGSLPERARPSEAIVQLMDWLVDRRASLKRYADFVRELGEPQRAVSLAELRELRTRLSALAPEHPAHAAAARFLAKPEHVLEGWWTLDAGKLHVWEDAAGKVGWVVNPHVDGAAGRAAGL